MTLEQREYGAGWVKCARCGVHDALSRKTYDSASKVFRCTDVAQCDRWRAELTAAGLTAGVDPAPTFVAAKVANAPRQEVTPRCGNAFVPAPPVLLRAHLTLTKRQLRAAELKAGNTALKTWAARPWVNPHGEHKVRK